jgi:hypothetical protein
MIFLLVYDRSKGKLIGDTTYADSQIEVANEARLDAEITNAENTDIEVVILKSESRDELEKTHGRYFKSLKQLSPSR